jgi:hypothetical protein
LFQETLGVRPVLETHHQIIGITDDNHVALRHFLAPGFDPQIEDVMQIDIRKQRRCH